MSSGTSRQSSEIGVQLGIPLLFSLMILAALIFATSMTMVLQERNELDPATVDSIVEVERARRAEQGLENLDRDVTELRRQLEEYPESLRQWALLEALRRELEEARRQLAATQADLDRIENENGRLRHERREGKNDNRRLAGRSAEDLAREARQLEEQIAALEKQIRDAGSKAEDAKSVPVGRFVPGGATGSAVFVECEKGGIRLMPAGRLLGMPIDGSAREELLTYAKRTGNVVFLVRPLGFDSFREYREVIENHNNRAPDLIDFAFEPIDEDWKMTYDQAATQ